MALSLRARRRPSIGPALRKAPLPFASTVLSAVVHAGLVVVVIVGAALWRANQPRIYVVNLVPTIAAVGAPQAPREPTPVARPPRVEPAPAPDVPKSRPAPRPRRPEPPPELPQRAPDLPERTPELPQRASTVPERATELPARAAQTDSVGLPDRTLTPRPPGLPRPDDKERPQVATAKPMPAPAPVPAPRPSDPVRPVPAAPPPPPPPGQPTGSPTGAGTVTLDVSDFPYAWYLAQIHRKVSEKWDGKAIPGRQPVVVFEIRRDGQVIGLAVEKTSGNSLYDRAALRAIEEAKPFAPLPEDFKEPVLRVHLGFAYSADRG